MGGILFSTCQNFPLFTSEEFLQSNISDFIYFITSNPSTALPEVREWPALLLTIRTTGASIEQASCALKKDYT
jgi:hypothetical protein